jgi:HEPN domain-containing protein
MDNLQNAQEWWRLADMDLSTAEYLVGMRPMPIEIICYHSQQAAEKYLKGYLVLHGNTPPKTRDLNVLLKQCTILSPELQNISDPCSDLTAYGVQPRYPMEWVLDEVDVHQALANAKAVWDCIKRQVT